MSPRAACRLDTLGFEHVYDYLSGKADWIARALPREGTQAADSRAVDFARKDVVTCRLGDRVGGVRERVKASPYGFALVVTAGGGLLRRPRGAGVGGEPEGSAEAGVEARAAAARGGLPPPPPGVGPARGARTTAVVFGP